MGVPLLGGQLSQQRNDQQRFREAILGSNPKLTGCADAVDESVSGSGSPGHYISVGMRCRLAIDFGQRRPAGYGDALRAGHRMESLISISQMMLLLAAVLFVVHVLMRVVLWAFVREPNPRADQLHQIAGALPFLVFVAGGLALLLILIVWGLSLPPSAR